MKKINIFTTVSIVALSMGTGVIPAHADQNIEPARHNNVALEEIVVTATKRATNLQDTAMSISVLTGGAMEKRGITNITEFLSTIPGVSMGDQSPGRPLINMRGVTTSNTSEGRATTSVYLDDFPLALKARDIRLLDVERVEVLKGPQGTLYGQSAMGGVIRYITGKPNMDRISGRATAYVSNTAHSDGANYGVNGHINLPLTDNLAIRLVGYHFDNDGFVDVKGFAPQKDANTENTTGGRFALRWTPTESTTLDFVYLNQSIKTGSDLRVSETFSLVPTVPEITLQPIDLSNPTDQNASPRLTEDEIFNVKLEVDFDSFNLSLMAAHKKLIDNRNSQQGGYLDLSQSQANQKLRIKTNIKTLEARLVSNNDGDDFFDWIAGVWYEDFDSTTSNFIDFGGPDASFYGFFPLTEGFVLSDMVLNDTSTEIAFYGEVSAHFSDRVTLTLGYRYSDVEIDQNIIKAVGPLAGAQAALLGVKQAVQENVSTFKANLEYTLSDDILLYGQASSGYRAGGFNAANPVAGTDPSAYKSDTLWNYELGARTTWLHGRLRANVTAYHIDWSNIQLTTELVGSSGNALITANSGKAKVDGVEVELDYNISDTLTFGVNYSYLDGVLKQDVPTAGALAGDRLPGSAKNTYSIRAGYESSISDNLDLSVRLTHKYIGSRLSTLGAGGSVQTASLIPSYNTTDVRFTISHVNGIEVSLFVNNIFDNIGITWIENVPLQTRRSITQPRIIGLNIGARF